MKTEIFIDQGEFKGDLLLSSNNVKIPLVTTTITTKSGTKQCYKAEVEPGTHWLDTGAGVASSTIVFRVDSTGTLVGVQPLTAATANATTLTLKTVEIEICSGDYQGKYRTTLLPPDESFDIDASKLVNGLLKLHAVVDVAFYIGNSARLGGSSFRVIAHKDERMKMASIATEADRVSLETSNSDASYASGSRISLRTANFTVVKLNANEPISISGYKKIGVAKSVSLIRGLKTRITCGKELVLDFVPM